MSRGFNGTSAALTRSAGLITAFPFTINVWFRPAALSGSEVDFFCTHDQGVTGNVVRLFMDGLDSYRVTLGLFDGAYDFAKATGNPTTNAWQMATAVATSASSYACFFNGGGKATNTTPSTINLSATNRVALGRESFGTSNWFNGQLAHCAVWSAALADAEVAVLAAGLLPTKVRSASLTAYWSLSGKDSPEIDIVGRNDLTVTNATVSNEEPRIFRNYA